MHVQMVTFNTINHSRESGAYVACENGRLQILHTLISFGIDVNEKYEYGLNLLLVACHYGYRDIIVSPKNDDGGENCAQYVCDRGYENIIDMLNEAGADISSKDNDGWILLSILLPIFITDFC